MAEKAELRAADVGLVIEALEDAMFFRDARSRIPKMSAESRQRDREKVAAYQALAVRLKQQPK